MPWLSLLICKFCSITEVFKINKSRPIFYKSYTTTNNVLHLYILFYVYYIFNTE